MKKSLLIGIAAALLLVLNAFAFSFYSLAREPIPTTPIPTGCYQTSGYCSKQGSPVLTYLCEPRVSGIVKCTVYRPSTCSGESWCIFPLDFDVVEALSWPMAVEAEEVGFPYYKH